MATDQHPDSAADLAALNELVALRSAYARVLSQKDVAVEIAGKRLLTIDSLRLRISRLEAERNTAVDLAALRLTQADTLRKRIADVERCLGFFASVIKSGEGWTGACQEEYDKALYRLDKTAPEGVPPGTTAAALERVERAELHVLELVRSISQSDAALRAAEAERDEARAALKTIADFDHSDDFVMHSGAKCRRIARAALQSTKEGK